MKTIRDYVIDIVAVVLCALGLLGAEGCQGNRSDVKGGTTAIKRTETVSDERAVFPEYRPPLDVVRPAAPPVVLKSSKTTTVEGTANGASAVAIGDKVDQKITGETPSLDLGEIGSASGGGFSSKSKVYSPPQQIGVAIIGGLFVLGGILVLAIPLGVPKPKLGFLLLGTGACILLSLISVWFLLGVGLAVAGAFVLAIMHAHGEGSTRGALGRLAAGLKKHLPAEVYADAKTAVGQETTDKDDHIIERAKQLAGV